MDVRERGRLPFWAALASFERDSPYNRRDALETLTKEKERQLDLIINAGIALTSILESWPHKHCA